jgi:hypothetical protein
MLLELVVRLKDLPDGYVEVTIWKQQSLDSPLGSVYRACVHPNDQLLLRVQEQVNNQLTQIVNTIKRRKQ